MTRALTLLAAALLLGELTLVRADSLHDWAADLVPCCFRCKEAPDCRARGECISCQAESCGSCRGAEAGCGASADLEACRQEKKERCRACCKKFWRWLTWCPTKAKACDCCHKCQQCSWPPLYLYFVCPPECGSGCGGCGVH